jgi:hypothetical protein
VQALILPVLVAWLAATPVLAASRGGAQAVVFPKWSSSSVNNLVAAVNEAAPAAFELAQCPFFGGSDRWGNTAALLRGVNGNIRLVGTFFLSFHTDHTGYDLGRRAANLNAFLITPRPDLGNKPPIDRLAHLVLSPQLEDEFTDSAWKAKAKAILDELDETKVLRSGKLSLRRSVYRYASNLSSLEYHRGGNRYVFSVRVERHGVGMVPADGSWSNDGDFVYSTLKLNGVSEDGASVVDKNNSGLRRMALASFVSKARSQRGTTTLWRPAYNVWRRETANAKVRWVRDEKLPKPWDRVDSKTTFDEREKRVLKDFLNGLN